MKHLFTIREVTTQDAQEMLHYLQQIGGESHNLSFGAEGLPIDEKQEEAIISQYQRHTINKQWCAVKDQHIIGVCDLHVPDRKRMQHRASLAISVRKPYWHQGVGHALMQTMMDYAKTKKQITMIALEVLTDNARAIALYQHFGFQKVGTMHQFFQIENIFYDADIMECDLRKECSK